MFFCSLGPSVWCETVVPPATTVYPNFDQKKNKQFKNWKPTVPSNSGHLDVVGTLESTHFPCNHLSWTYNNESIGMMFSIPDGQNVHAVTQLNNWKHIPRWIVAIDRIPNIYTPGRWYRAYARTWNQVPGSNSSLCFSRIRTWSSLQCNSQIPIWTYNYSLWWQFN